LEIIVGGKDDTV